MLRPLLSLVFTAALALSAGAVEPVWLSPAKLALEKGAGWLQAQQQPDGSFANPQNAAPSQDHPALTALPVLALQASSRVDSAAQLAQSYRYLRSKVQPDGGIYVKGLSNYNTSVCLMALLGAKASEDEALLSRARAFVAEQQASTMAKPELNGGFGYGPTGSSPKRQHPDLDNTLVALEALAAYRAAHPAVEQAATPDFNYQAAIDFITRCQNLPPQNPLPWASADVENRGGFLYYPGFSNAGEQPLEGGGKALRSYGTMSYAGLLSFIYARLEKNDPRVQAAMDWLIRHYTLDENPGLGRQGLFYYYHLAAKALTAAQIGELTLADGTKVDWRRALMEKLAAAQQPDGRWVNDTGRWMETDPVLVTSYCVLALQRLIVQP